MAQFSLKVWAANHAVAEVTSYGRDDKHVSIEIPDETCGMLRDSGSSPRRYKVQPE